MNWGYKLTIGMIIFMGFIIYLTTRMMRSPTETVTEKYYEKGLHYGERMEKLRRGGEHPPEIAIAGKVLSLGFPASVDSVDVVLIRPQNTRVERTFSEAGPLDSCSFDLNELRSGRWKMTLDWKQDGLPSALETDIVLP